MVEAVATADTQRASGSKMQQFENVCAILDKHDRDAGKLIPILQEIQEEFRYLPEEVLTYVATCLRLPPARVFGVATFYAHFTLKPKGKHIIRLCDGTACHVKGSMDILDALRKKLNLPEGKDTTDDQIFTVETVSCLGACGLAPVMVIDEDVHGQVSPEMAEELLQDIFLAEGVK